MRTNYFSDYKRGEMRGEAFRESCAAVKRLEVQRDDVDGRERAGSTEGQQRPEDEYFGQIADTVFKP